MVSYEGMWYKLSRVFVVEQHLDLEQDQNQSFWKATYELTPVEFRMKSDENPQFLTRIFPFIVPP